MYKKIGIVALTITLLFAGYWLSTQGTKAPTIIPAPRDTLIVGTNVGYPPFIFTDATGEVTGFDVDISRAIAEKMGKKLVIRDMAFDALLLALDSGSVDIIIGGITISEERKKTGILMPYYISRIDSVALFYPRKKPYKDFTLEKAAWDNLTICTQAGSVFEEMLSKHEGITIKTVPDISDIVLEVTQGNSDCGLLDTDSVRVLARTTSAIDWHEMPLPKNDEPESFGLGIKADNIDMKVSVAEAILALAQEKKIDSLVEKWFTPGA